MVVAIDGPAGAGKSTVARRLAVRIGGAYLNTGAMYRAVAWRARRDGVSIHDADGLARLAATHEITLQATADGERVLVDGEDVTEQTRSGEVTADVSVVAAHGPLRRVIVARQQQILKDGDWVADGRDIGTVVAPHAEVKIYLTADPQVRAKRRYDELVAGGADVLLGDILQEITSRDASDSTRDESPLTVASGAHVVDTTGLAVDQVVDTLSAIVDATRGGRS